MSTPSFYVVIPARYQSTRLPGKPLADILGKPMVQWVYEAAQRSAAIGVCIATDDKRVEAAVESFGGRVRMTSANHVSGTDRLAEVAAQAGWADDTIIVNVQGDEPTMDPALINQVGELLAAHPEAGVATLCVPVTDVAEMNNPNAVKVVLSQRGLALYFSRAAVPWNRDGETLAVPGYRHLGIYAYRVSALQQFVSWPTGQLEQVEKLEQLRFLEHGVHIAVAVADLAPPAGVDTPEDLARVIRLLAEREDA
ncbi:3-deoxy-manno-octulosonate cytidylyltransferase [Salinispirillum sp. LH 10-3-1]|uniref:3-deoxy-manno-octulosonate cytidylyltransferase n=1 Tax=Salinispirillum sp. LH 10-3-1 TaxID=2952525 RepID=A0AB38YCC3_9GAMM